jgi:hypothetical protein
MSFDKFSFNTIADTVGNSPALVAINPSNTATAYEGFLLDSFLELYMQIYM